MVTITLSCPHCGSEALVRDGHAKNSAVCAASAARIARLSRHRVQLDQKK